MIFMLSSIIDSITEFGMDHGPVLLLYVYSILGVYLIAAFGCLIGTYITTFVVSRL